MKRVFALVLLLLPALAQPVARELKATVVGDGVGWETHAFRIWLVIPEKGGSGWTSSPRGLTPRTTGAPFWGNRS